MTDTSRQTPLRRRHHRKLPLEPLLDAVHNAGYGNMRRRRDVEEDDIAKLARLIGISRGALTTRIRDGVSWSTADRYACAAHLHPLEVWGDAWLEGAA